jgi:hypothetical protein
MTTRSAAVRGWGVAAVVFAGACAEGVPTEPPGTDGVGALFARSAGAAGAYTGTLDHEFERIAGEIPGFAGLYYDAAGTLNVVMAPVAEPMAPGELQMRLATRLEALGRDPAAAATMVIREGTFDFGALLEMRRQVDQVVWGLHGIVYTDADEMANRVAIGVEDTGARAAVEQAVGMLGIPDGAVEIRTAEPIRLSASPSAPPMSGHTLQDLVRPAAGGLALRNSHPFFNACGLGFNVRSPEAPGVHGFVTHAFCADNHYGTGPLSTTYWQPHPDVPGSLVGFEAHNAPPFTEAPCPPNPSPDFRGCRWSTAAGARYAAGVFNAFGAIHRTTGLGSIEIDPDRPTFEIVGEVPMSVLGQEVHKVGAQTGWTQGTVDQTCVNHGHFWSSPASVGAVTVLCIDRAALTGNFPLDWGAPVFEREGEDGARLAGIVSFTGGGAVWFSPMGQIRLENPPPPGRSWRTHP